MPEAETAAAEDRKAGLVIVLTGNGKGKTTGALGMVIRTLGYGKKAAVLQFIKDCCETGEKLFFDRLRDKNLHFEQLGCGFCHQAGDHAGAARTGWKKAEEYLSGRIKTDLLVLDEINIALHQGYLDAGEVIDALRSRTPELNVVLTGRYAPEAICNASDMVSAIQEIKHPFQNGITARKCIDF